jgi:putative acetyltransferase
MEIREAAAADLGDVLSVERAAFGEDEGPKITDLVAGLLEDPSAEPRLSLLAIRNGRAAGHILFTRIDIADQEDAVNAAILAPLAVRPEVHSQGIGGALIKEGLKRLTASGVELVFVLGHPDYYPRHGFQTAGILGFEAPYPILEKNADAWMVQELRPGFIGKLKGRVVCAEALDKPEHWRE